MADAPPEFLGRGWAFPVALAGPDGTVARAAYQDSIEQAIWLILSTAKGERPMRPDFGCGIHDLVFALNDATTAGRVTEEVRDALALWEPRVELQDVSVTVGPAGRAGGADRRPGQGDQRPLQPRLPVLPDRGPAGVTLAAPPIDTRTAADLAAAIEDRLRRYAGWQPQAALPVPDPGYALSRIVARFMEIGIDRLNRAPDKALLAFLDLLGLELLPPQAARAPLTFTLATGAQADARVPAGTRVAAQPLPGDPGPVLFETERDLLVTRSSLVAVLSREPGRDRYADHATLVAPGRVDPVRVFAGDRPIRHRLYLGHEALLATDAAKTVTVTIAPADPDAGWPYRLAWGWWDGAAVAGLGAAVASTGGAWQVRLDAVPAVPEAAIAGRSSRWLVADLTTPLPHGDPLPPAASGPTVLARAGMAPDAAWRDAGAAGLQPLDPGQPFSPLGDNVPAMAFLLASELAFGKPGAVVTLAVAADPEAPARPTPDLQLAWEFWDGAAWQRLGTSTPSAVALAGSTRGFADGTLALTASGVVTFRSPAAWAAGAQGGVPGYWLRVRVAAGGFTGTPLQAPRLSSLTLGFTWPLPAVASLGCDIAVTRPPAAPDLAFQDTAPLETSKDFRPFGDRPRVGDALVVSSAAFVRPAPGGTHAVTLRARRSALDPAASPRRHDGGRAGLGVPDRGRLAAPRPLGLAAGDRAARERALRLPRRQRRLHARRRPDGAPITFQAPADWGETVYGGQTGRWLRVRVSRGGYGSDARYQVVTTDGHTPATYPNTNIPVMQLVPASFRPPSLAALTAASSYRSAVQPFDHLLAENDFALAEPAPGGFAPFVPPADPSPALYLGFDRPGAATGFANDDVALFLAVAQPVYGGTDTAPAGSPPRVGWSYWDGGGWAQLAVQDETQDLTRPGVVSFVGPPDFGTRSDFGRDAFWLRATRDGATLPCRGSRPSSSTRPGPASARP